MSNTLIIRCAGCGLGNQFPQPWLYHAGHADQGFLYNDAGNLTLVWSSFDPAWEALVGPKHPWTLSPDSWARVEDALAPAPTGGMWRSSNPPRCRFCSAPIERAIAEGAISYVAFPGSLLLDEPVGSYGFARALR
jgi:hypothetical protein